MKDRTNLQAEPTKAHLLRRRELGLKGCTFCVEKRRACVGLEDGRPNCMMCEKRGLACSGLQRANKEEMGRKGQSRNGKTLTKLRQEQSGSSSSGSDRSVSPEESLETMVIATQNISPCTSRSQLAREQLGVALSFHLIELATRSVASPQECVADFMQAPRMLLKYVQEAKQGRGGMAHEIVLASMMALAARTSNHSAIVGHPSSEYVNIGRRRHDACVYFEQRAINMMDFVCDSDPSYQNLELVCALRLVVDHGRNAKRLISSAHRFGTQLLLHSEVLTEEQKETVFMLGQELTIFDALVSARERDRPVLTDLELEKYYHHPKEEALSSALDLVQWNASSIFPGEMELAVALANICRSICREVSVLRGERDVTRVLNEFNKFISYIKSAKSYLATRLAYLWSYEGSTPEAEEIRMAEMEEICSGLRTGPTTEGALLSFLRSYGFDGMTVDERRRIDEMEMMMEEMWVDSVGESLIIFDLADLSKSDHSIVISKMLSVILHMIPGWEDILVKHAVSETASFSKDKLARFQRVLVGLSRTYGEYGDMELLIRMKLAEAEKKKRIGRKMVDTVLQELSSGVEEINIV